MLILVGVTINLATDGGLFTKARTAKSGTQRELDRENLLAAIMTGFKEGGDFNITEVVLPDNMKWCEEETTEYLGKEATPTKGEGCWVITKSNNKFYLDEYGSILDEKPLNPIIGKYTFHYESAYFEILDNGKAFYHRDGEVDEDGKGTEEKNVNGTYSYDQNTKIIKIKWDEGSLNKWDENCELRIYNINYMEKGEQKINKVALLDSALIGMTSGFAGFDKYTFTSGTYKNSEDSTLELSIQTDENGNNYGYLVAYGSDKTPYLCIDGYIYVGWEPYKIVSETEIGYLDDEGNVDFIFSKVD